MVLTSSITTVPPVDRPGTITGTAGDDWIARTESDDTINSLAGNDFIHAPIGNNVIDGGAGADTLIIDEGVKSSYLATANDDGTITLTGPGLNGRNVSNQLRNVENVAFKQLLGFGFE